MGSQCATALEWSLPDCKGLSDPARLKSRGTQHPKILKSARQVPRPLGWGRTIALLIPTTSDGAPLPCSSMCATALRAVLFSYSDRHC